MEPHTKTLVDYIEVLRRRKMYILVPWLLITLASVIVAYYIPKTFRSTAMLLMESPLPAKLTDSSDSLYANDQIQTIYQRVMTTNTVMGIIKKFQLYGQSEADPANKYDLVAGFKESTEVELALSSLADRNAKMTNIVFNLSFNYKEPGKAQAVVNELAAVMIAQNDKGRTQSADRLTQFLTEELEKLTVKSQELDRKIAEYKERNSHSLPEKAELNQAAFDRYENDLKDNASQIRAVKQKIEFLEMALKRAKTVVPNVGTDNTPKTKAEALRSLQAQYVKMSSVYSPSHPSLVRLKREIAALGAMEDETTADAGELDRQIKKAQEDLAVLEKSYAAGHPDIQKTRKQISLLQEQLAKAGGNPKPDLAQASDPVDIELQMQMRSSQAELAALLEKDAFLKRKFDQAQANLSVSPQVEVAYSDLLRERDSTLKKYNQLKEKWLDAKLVQSMEQQQQGHTLSIIEPAFLPTHPENAIRRKVAIGGFLGGLAFGVGLAFLVEFFDPGIKGYRALVAATGLMPLVIIPYIDSPTEENRKRAASRQNQKAIVWTVMLGGLLLVAFIVAYYGFMK